MGDLVQSSSLTGSPPLLDKFSQPPMPDETQRRYLYAAIVRVTRRVYLEVRSSMLASDAETFFPSGR